MPKKYLAISCFLFIAIIIAGCAGGSKEVGSNDGASPKVSQSQLYNAEDLLSREDAESILEEAVGDPEITESPVGSVCFYSPQVDGLQVRFVQISLHQTRAFTDAMQSNGYTAAQLYDDSLALLEDTQPIEGLGKDAFWGGSGLQAGAGLHVLQNDDLYFSISVGLGNDEDNLAAAQILAERVMQRL